jgi:hypothetical protein
MPATITIDPINGVLNPDIISSWTEGGNLYYSGTEQGLDGATLTFIYEIGYGPFPVPWQGAQPTTAADGKWQTVPSGFGYTVYSVPDGVYTITASSDGVSASRQLIQADHGHTPFESVGLAFDGETQQLAGKPPANFAPTYLAVDQFIMAEQAGIDILQRDNIITTSQASKLQNFFQREFQVLGKQALSSDLLPVKQIDKLMGLQADVASYVAHTPALVALQPNDAGWTMPAMPPS